MPEEEHFVISVYAPIIFPPAPVLVYKDSETGERLFSLSRGLCANP